MKTKREKIYPDESEDASEYFHACEVAVVELLKTRG